MLVPWFVFGPFLKNGRHPEKNVGVRQCHSPCPLGGGTFKIMASNAAQRLILAECYFKALKVESFTTLSSLWNNICRWCWVRPSLARPWRRRPALGRRSSTCASSWSSGRIWPKPKGWRHLKQMKLSPETNLKYFVCRPPGEASKAELAAERKDPASNSTEARQTDAREVVQLSEVRSRNEM